jgi:uncharacterized membrane protein YvlD (DUF360 family)
VAEHRAPYIVRSASDRPYWRQVLWRSSVVTVIIALALWILAAVLAGFTIDEPADALLAGFVVGVANAVIWPALSFLIVPLSVLTLGLGAIVLNALFVTWVLELMPGSRSMVLDLAVHRRRPCHRDNRDHDGTGTR